MLRLAFCGLLLAGLALPQPTAAQGNPAKQKCLQEAEAKGLLSTVKGPMTERHNQGLKGQRMAFMKECMARR